MIDEAIVKLLPYFNACYPGTKGTFHIRCHMGTPEALRDPRFVLVQGHGHHQILVRGNGDCTKRKIYDYVLEHRPDLRVRKRKAVKLVTREFVAYLTDVPEDLSTLPMAKLALAPAERPKGPRRPRAAVKRDGNLYESEVAAFAQVLEPICPASEGWLVDHGAGDRIDVMAVNEHTGECRWFEIKLDGTTYSEGQIKRLRMHRLAGHNVQLIRVERRRAA